MLSASNPLRKSAETNEVAFGSASARGIELPVEMKKKSRRKRQKAAEEKDA